MSAYSDKQKHFMTMVKAYKSGKLDLKGIQNAEEIKKAAQSMSYEDIEDFIKECKVRELVREEVQKLVKELHPIPMEFGPKIKIRTDKKFSSGFVKGDKVIQKPEVSGDRYVIVSNNGKTFVVSDTGERRQQIIVGGDVKFNPPLDRLALTGDLPLSSITDKLTESYHSQKYGQVVDDLYGIATEDGLPAMLNMVADVCEDIDPKVAKQIVKIIDGIFTVLKLNEYINMDEEKLIDKYKKAADKIGEKVQNKINRKGSYENAGQDEIRKFMDTVRKDSKLGYHAQSIISDYINDVIDNLQH